MLKLLMIYPRAPCFALYQVLQILWPVPAGGSTPRYVGTRTLTEDVHSSSVSARSQSPPCTDESQKEAVNNKDTEQKNAASRGPVRMTSRMN